MGSDMSVIVCYYFFLLKFLFNLNVQTFKGVNLRKPAFLEMLIVHVESGFNHLYQGCGSTVCKGSPVLYPTIFFTSYSNSLN